MNKPGISACVSPGPRLLAALHQHALWLSNILTDPETGRRVYRLGTSENPLPDLRLIDLSGLNMKLARFKQADFSNSKLRNADLWGGDFHYASLRFVDLTGANLAKTEMQFVDLRGAKFTTEVIKCNSLYQVKCDDSQLPWLILHPHFSRHESQAV